MAEEQVVDVAETQPETEEFWGDESNVETKPEVELDAFDDALMQNQPVKPVSGEADAPKSTNDERYEYWQSRYDKKASDFDDMSKKLSDYERLAPIAEYIQENPGVLNNVARSLSGDNQQVPSQDKSDESLKKPTRPTKPVNYDATEAYMDVESDSYKYRASLDDYRDSMIDYQENLEDARMQQAQMRQVEIQKQEEAYKRTQAVDTMRNQLVNTYGYTDGKAQEFIDYYSKPESLSLENLVNLDRIRSSPSQAEVATKQKVETMTRQSERMAVPPPAGIQSGKAEPQFTDEDLFNLGLMNNRKP